MIGPGFNGLGACAGLRVRRSGAFRNHSSRSAARLHCRDCPTSTNIKGRGVHPDRFFDGFPSFNFTFHVEIFVQQNTKSSMLLKPEMRLSPGEKLTQGFAGEGLPSLSLKTEDNVCA